MSVRMLLKIYFDRKLITGMTRLDEQPGNHACRLLSKHGVDLCSATATLRERQTRQIPRIS